MKIVKPLKFILVSMSLASCSPTKVPGTSADKSAASASAKLSGTGTKTGTSTGTADGSGTSSGGTTSSTGRGMPNFQSGDASGLNKTTGPKLVLKPPEDAKKVFLVQRISSYRPIWLDLTKPLEEVGDFWNFMSKVSTAVDSSAVGGFTREVFELEKGERTKEVSIHQAITSFAESNDMVMRAERGDVFKPIGHTVNKGLGLPTIPTAVLSLYAIPPSDPLSQAIAPPMSYQTVYTRLGPLTADLLEPCTNVQKAGANGRMPHAVDTAKCNEVTGGASTIYDFTNVQMGGSTTTGVGDLSNFFTMQTLVVWQAIPQPGYQCLGHIVTNTPEQPATSADAGGMSAQSIKTLVPDQNGKMVEQYDWDIPIYCVAEKFLVPGMLVPLATNGLVDFYAIAPDPKYPKGLAKQNLFYAVPTTMSDADRAKIKVWVLNTDFVKVLPDLAK